MEQEAFLLKISKTACRFKDSKIPHAVFITELKRQNIETSNRLLESILNNCTVWEYTDKNLFIYLDLLHESIYQSLQGKRNYSEEMDLWICCFGDRDIITWNQFSSLYLKKLREIYSNEEVDRIGEIVFKHAVSNDELIYSSYFTQLAKTASFNQTQRKNKVNQCVKCLWLTMERVIKKRSWRLFQESYKDFRRHNVERGALKPIPPNILKPTFKSYHTTKRSKYKEYFQKYVESKTLNNPINYINLTHKLQQLKSQNTTQESAPTTISSRKRLSSVSNLLKHELLLMVYYKQYLKNTFKSWKAACLGKRKVSLFGANLNVSRIAMIDIPQSSNVSMISSKEANKIISITSLCKILQDSRRSQLKLSLKAIQVYPVDLLNNLDRIYSRTSAQALSKSFVLWAYKSSFLHSLNLYTNRWIDAMTRTQYKLLYEEPTAYESEESLNKTLPTRHLKQPSFGNKF